MSYTYYSTNDPTIFILFHLVFWPLIIASAITHYRYAKAAGNSNAWLAFVPFGFMILRLQLAEMSGWLIILMFIPFLNFIFLIVYLYALHQSFALPTGKPAGGKLVLCLIGLEFVANTQAKNQLQQAR